MKKSVVIASTLGLIFFSTPVHADSAPANDQSTEAPSMNGVGPIQTPEPRDAQGREIREPREHNEHEGRGPEIESISIVIGAVVIAIGLAYGIGRRNGNTSHARHSSGSK